MAIENIKAKVLEVVDQWDVNRLRSELKMYIDQDTDEELERMFFEDVATEEEMIAALEAIQEFGKVTFEGKEIALTTQADFTNRVLAGRRNHHEAAEGETYDAQFSAQGTDESGNQVTVYWVFEITKGNEPALDSLDWDKVDNVVQR